jgi:flagellar protein FlaI
MSEHGTPTLSPELKRVAGQHDHVKRHLAEFFDEYGEYPILIDDAEAAIDGDADKETQLAQQRRPNVMYQVDDEVFIHIYGDRGVDKRYMALEPELTDEDIELLNRVRDRILKLSSQYPAPETDEEFPEYLDNLLDEVLDVGADEGGIVTRLRRTLTGQQLASSTEVYDRIRYHLHRDIAGLGNLSPVMLDPANEDIHVIGPNGLYTDHGVFGMVETDISFGTDIEFDNWLKNLGERIENPVSDSDPIVDSTLPDGSRLSLIYSDDVSVQGPSLTIRQGDDVPLSIFQLVAWETLSPELAAYLWLCLENERTVFVVGETASGKTTTLNAILSFIPRDSKIYTAEDTAEVIPPHMTWQQLLTRESPGEDESNDVDLFDLVAAALRSRPDYIIVGEVRGAEAQMAFQAAQTGHPVMLTFHASDVNSMLQRFTGAPINIPETFIDNADVALFQNRVKRGDQILRRVTSVAEIEGYNKHLGGVVTREVFAWEPSTDDIVFKGQNNSYILENKIAELLGYENTADIYDDMNERAEIIRRCIDAEILGYDEVNEAIETYQRDGPSALDINTSGLR